MRPKQRHFLGRFVLPFSRAELPGWGRFAAPLGAFDPRASSRWTDLPPQTIRGKLHGYRMILDLRDWAQRLTWFTGRYYELDTQLVLRTLVKPGDTVIDVGANIGMITLLASHLVGPEGRVLSFEPNPNPRGRLRHHIEINGIKNVDIFDVALSDIEEEKTLKVDGSHDGIGTLANRPDFTNVTQIHRLMTAIGDNTLPPALKGKVFIKIDVEGYEPRVLRGLARTIEKYRPTILTEIEPAHLESAGSSTAELFQIMEAYGYIAFGITVKRKAIHYKCRLDKIEERHVRSSNVVWAHESTINLIARRWA